MAGWKRLICGVVSMRKNELVQKTYVLKCISPVHIGNGETLKAFEYLYDRQAETVCFLDESKWIAFLAEHRLMDVFTEYLTKTVDALVSGYQYKGDNIWEWLQHQGITHEEIYRLGIRHAKAKTNALRGVKGSLNDIVCQMAMADGRPYIPGSSIKGALRTGLLYRLLQQNPKMKEKYWQEIMNIFNDEKIRMNRKKSEWAKHMRRMEDTLLGRLNNPKFTGKLIKPQLRSVLRGLSISDAVCGSGQTTIILKKIDASTVENKLGKTEKILPLSRECIPAGTVFHFQITMDKAMMAEVGIHDSDELLAAVRQYTAEGLKLQMSVFGSQYSREFTLAQEADLLLGGGTGFLSKSLLYALAPSTAAAISLARNYMDANFRLHKHRSLDKRISPRTLKLTRADGACSIMGLCQIKETGGC